MKRRFDSAAVAAAANAAILAYEFQTAIKKTDIEKAASAVFAAPMDNSTSYVGANPVRLFCEIPTSTYDTTTVAHRNFQTVFERLMKTGAAAVFANQIDQVDRKRPVDVADITQMAIILNDPNRWIDTRPSKWFSPLIRSMNLLFRRCVMPLYMISIWNDDSLLDWTDPAGMTALYYACHHVLVAERYAVAAKTEPADERFGLLNLLVSKAGCVDPTRSCLSDDDFVKHAGIAARLTVAKLQYQQFVNVDRPAMLLDVLSTILLPPILAFVCDYSKS